MKNVSPIRENGSEEQKTTHLDSTAQHEFDQVRELLFGQHSRQTDDRIEQVQNALNKTADNLEKKFDGRLSQMSERYDTSHAALKAKLSADSGSLDARLKAMEEDFDNKLHALSESMQQSVLDERAHIANMLRGMASVLIRNDEQA